MIIRVLNVPMKKNTQSLKLLIDRDGKMSPKICYDSFTVTGRKHDEGFRDRPCKEYPKYIQSLSVMQGKIRSSPKI